MMRGIIGIYLVACCGALAAAEIVYDTTSGETNLTEAAAWVGGVVPSTNDVVIFAGETPETLMLPADAAWAGIVRTNSANTLTLRAPEGGRAFALGAEGLRLYATDNAYHRLYLDAATTLTADQTWYWETNKTPCVMGSLTGGQSHLTLEAPVWDSNLLIAGTVDCAGLEIPKGLQVQILDGGSFVQNPTVADDGRLAVSASERDYGWSEFFPLHSLDLGGVLELGGKPLDTTFHCTNTITFASGDKLTGPNPNIYSPPVSSRTRGRVEVQETDVVLEEGAEWSGFTWLYLRNGSLTVKEGASVGLAYAANIGRGTMYDPSKVTSRLSTEYARLNLEGGTFTARRLSVGQGNTDSTPAEFRVSGGLYQSTMPNDTGWAATLSVGQRSASGEDISWRGQYTAGRVEITGGTVKTPSVFFGNENDPGSNNKGDDVHTGARFALRGGELQFGNGTMKTARYWKDTDSNDSWYDVAFSGGAFTRYGTADAHLYTDVYVTDRDGGTEWNIKGDARTCLDGSLYGPGGLRKTGPGELRLQAANAYTGVTEVVEGSVLLGRRMENAIWRADNYTGTGTASDTWSNIAGGDTTTWNFQSAGIISDIAVSGRTLTMPVRVDNDAFNGHPAVAFNGSSAMFITGNAAQPISEREGAAVVTVFRTEPGYQGGDSENAFTATQVFGTSIAGDWTVDRRYAISINKDGYVGSALQPTWKDKEGNTNCVVTCPTLWNTKVAVNDGNPHVVVWTWSRWEGQALRVDDQTVTQIPDDYTNVCRKLIKTRFIVGVGEQSKANTFKGEIADIRFAPMYVNPDARKYLTQDLGERYGVAAFAAETIPVEETVGEEIPAATATWRADTLTGTSGASVVNWPEADGKGADGGVWIFTQALADTVLKTKEGSGYPGQTTAPTISTNTANGHKMVAFNGKDAALGLTGSKATPVGNGSGATIAVVVRFTGYGQGGGLFDGSTAASFLGSAYSGAPGTADWGFCLSGAARVGAYRYRGGSGSYNKMAYSRRRFLDDGDVHVLVLTVPPQNADKTDAVIRLAVDGRVSTSPAYTEADKIIKTRILLGASEYGGARYAPVEVAEFRM